MDNEKIIKIKINREELKKEEPKKKSLIDLWEKIAKTCLYLLIFLVPLFFLPLTASPLEINKLVLAAFLIFITFICYLIRSLNTRRVIYPKSFLALAVLIIWLVVGISAVFSQASWTSVFGNFVQPDAFLAFSIYALTFFLTAVFFSKDDLPKIGLCFLAGLLPTLIFGCLQIFGKFILPWDFSRQTSFNSIGSTFSWGIFITFGLTMIVAALTSLKLSKIFKIILSLVALVIAATLILLNFQLLWIGLILAMFLLVAVKFANREQMTLPLVIIIISLFFVLINQQIPSLIVIPAEIKPNFSATLSVIKGTLTGKQILFGSGPATFIFDYARFRPPILNQTAFWPIRFSQGFSFLFSIPASLGIMGILAFLFLIFSFVRQSLRFLKKKESLIVIAGIFLLIIFLFIYPAFFTQLLFVFIGLGLLAVESKESLEIDFYGGNKWQRIRGLALFLTAILLLSFVLFTFYLTGQKYLAAVYYQKGNFNQAVRFDSQSDQYLRAFSQALILKGNQIMQTAAAVPPQDLQNLRTQFQNTIALAISSAQQAAALNPLDALNYSNLANIYENIIPVVKDADVFAEQNYRKAIEFEPSNPQAPVDLARMFVVSADQSPQKDTVWQEKLDKAKTALEQSIGLKSDYTPAHFLMAQIYLREDNLSKAIEKVEEIKNANPNDAGLAFQLGLLYYQNNQTEKAQNGFERAVALNENYSNARYFLGLIYDQKGQKLKALKEFEKIEVLNPDNQEVKNILANLRAGKPALENIVPPAQPPAERTEAPVSPSTKD
jgi:Flp pilus assembly protein TadD